MGLIVPAFALLCSLFVMSSNLQTVSAQLSSTFYDSSCPNALSIIKSAVTDAISSEGLRSSGCTSMTALLMQGCDGSVLLDDTTTMEGEKGAAPNANSLRGFDVVDTIKSNLESACPQTVSCADILAVAARDSVVQLGGPSWTVVLGRRDATTASKAAAESDLPSPFADLSDLETKFSNKKLSTKDLVVLSGGHTIGKSRCAAFRNRIYNETNIDTAFATSAQANCPSSGGDTNLEDLDVTTPNTFDNGYYQNLVGLKGLLHSDQVLFNNGSTDSMVQSYSSSQSDFFSDFATSMLNMGNIDPLTGTNGEIRINCRKAN